MTILARSERDLLCETALAAGGDAPTLCGDWTVKDLVVHLLVRERDLTGLPGMFVPALEGLTHRAERSRARNDFEDLVDKVRQGPPGYSPMGWRPFDLAVNTLEFFVHHEDVRRAQPGWEPRDLSEEEEQAIWLPLSLISRLLTRRAPVGIIVQRTDRESTSRLRGGEPSVVMTGPPSEVAMFLYGRTEQSRVELEGTPEDVAALRATDFGL
ncbi:TIGR03085 family protein [Nocardioidaceae bacterium]|nr:TIGR03085 family protein [Nocardioidaceae bacterium]